MGETERRVLLGVLAVGFLVVGLWALLLPARLLAASGVPTPQAAGASA